MAKKDADRIMTFREIGALLNAERVDQSAFWNEAAGGDMVPLSERDVLRIMRKVKKGNRR